MTRSVAFITFIGTLALSSAAAMAGALGPAYEWSGAYFGITAGWATNDTTLDISVDDPGSSFNDAVDRIEGDQATLMGGAVAGYNFQYNSIVFGIEASLDYLGFSDTSSQVRSLDIYSAASDTTFNANWLGTFRGRAGYTIGGLLLYGTAGLAAGDMEASASVNAIDMLAGEQAKWKSSTDAMNWGWTAGLGLEYGISNVSFGVEYLYVDLGSVNWDADPTGTLSSALGLQLDGSADYQFSLLRATAKFHL